MTNLDLTIENLKAISLDIERLGYKHVYESITGRIYVPNPNEDEDN